jgi:accessory colonization factor AcfC
MKLNWLLSNLRPGAILVRLSHPKNIRDFHDLPKSGAKVLTVAGAAQTGLWEDVAGRAGDIGMVRAFRKNRVFPEAANSGVAKQRWMEHKQIDAWLIWNIWRVAHPSLAAVVSMAEPFRVCRDAGACNLAAPSPIPVLCCTLTSACRLP